MREDNSRALRGVAVRRDDALGIREEAEFFGGGPDRIFGIRYVPESRAPLAGVVICEPLMLQFVAHYRYGTLLARSLAAAGFAVQRFQYRGTHNSDGDIRGLSLDTMYADTREAVGHLRDAAEIDVVAFVGVQIGAYPAARASADGSALVIDSPPPEGRLYLRDVFRSHAVVTMQDGPSAQQAAPSKADLLERMRSEDDLVLLGCRFPRALYDSVEGSVLSDELGPERRPVLVIGGSHHGELKPEARRVQDELVASGFEVDHLVRASQDPFLFVEHSAPEDQAAVAETNRGLTDWLGGVFVRHWP